MTLYGKMSWKNGTDGVRIRPGMKYSLLYLVIQDKSKYAKYSFNYVLN